MTSQTSQDSLVKMKEYSIYDAKAKLSELLRYVKSTGSVTITDRGKPVAKVIPISSELTGLEARLKQLEENGLVQKAKGSHKMIKPIAHRPGAVKRFLESRD